MKKILTQEEIVFALYWAEGGTTVLRFAAGLVPPSKPSTAISASFQAWVSPNCIGSRYFPSIRLKEKIG